MISLVKKLVLKLFLKIKFLRDSRRNKVEDPYIYK